MSDIEKLGYFYLGRRYDVDSGQTLDEPVLYDSRDLTTHAVCIGMTGSGKTGLCVALLEEAAIDGVPAIAIDPKGDLGNLLLTFPDLEATSFRPWVDEAAAARNGIDPDEEAKRIAGAWREGLAKWGQDGARIASLRDAVDIDIYTPGSGVGRRLSVLGSLSAPSADLIADAEALTERVETAASSLLTLLGIAGDPLQSREHVLLATIFQDAWKAGKALSVEELVRRVQRPPFERVGALALDSFYPEKERFNLAVSLNNLVASPGFAFWGEGEPLEIERLLYTSEGKPRLSILSIAHLDERERMFVVTLVLNEFVAWVRRQPGTQSLRAILYMDEVFGFLPPSANPSSKRPLLTLLKQARAHGVGVVLATQNPVDLDYKALSNAGTWFLGRLQTERDKARVLDGLDTLAASGLERAKLDSLLSSLGKRVFLMHNVHEDGPLLLHSRWALSYLAGPLSREQIGRLTAVKSTTEPAPAKSKDVAAPGEAPGAQMHANETRPVVEPGVAELFAAPGDTQPRRAKMLYRPALHARARLHFVHARSDLDEWETISLFGTVAPSDPAGHEGKFSDDTVLDTEPAADAAFLPLPECGSRAASHEKWARNLAGWLYSERKREIWHAPRVETWSRPGEAKRDFIARVRTLDREKRDRKVDKMRERYASKIATLTERLRRAEQRVERETEQYQTARGQTAISLGTAVLGALFGRKLGSVGTLGRAGTTMRSAGRAAQQKSDIDRAREDVGELQQQLAVLAREVEAEVARIAAEHDEHSLDVDTVEVSPRKSDIAVEKLSLAWIAAAPTTTCVDRVP